MTTIYYGDEKTRRVKATENGRTAPLSDKAYTWGDETGSITLATDLIYAITGSIPSLTLAARFAVREVSTWRKDRPWMFGEEALDAIISKIDAEIAAEEAAQPASP